MTFAPIVLFVYNRPDLVSRTLQHLQKNTFCSDSELFVYSDGAKRDEVTEKKVAEVREILKNISGFKNVTIVESEQNKGLANSIISGVTEVVERYGKIIVLEDDLETSPDFLRFMNEALEKYEDEQQVMQIAGHMFNVKLQVDSDTIFLPMTNSIGWATWKRSWNFFDPCMSGYNKLKENKELRDKFNLEGTIRYFEMLVDQLHNKIDSWAIRWYLSVFLNDGMVLYPTESLIRHIGFDEKATHATCNNYIYAQKCRKIFTEQIRFSPMEIDHDSLERIKRCLVSPPKNKVRYASIAKRFVSWRDLCWRKK